MSYLVDTDIISAQHRLVDLTVPGGVGDATVVVC